MLLVKKEKRNYIVTLGDEVFGTQDANELFDGFVNMLEVDRLQMVSYFASGIVKQTSKIYKTTKLIKLRCIIV